MKKVYRRYFGQLILGISFCIYQVTTWGNELSSRFQLAADLQIHQIASDTEFPDCTCLAVDKQDRIYAAGPGYIRVIQLNHHERTFKTVTNVTQAARQAAQGMCVNEGFLHYVADGAIWELELDSDLTDGGKRPTKRITLPTGGEHRSHAIRKGDDNHWYLIVGNDCDSMITLQNVINPAVSRPRAGMIWRFSNDWTQRSVIAHGLRNAYDFDFTNEGHLVTYDSDGERDVSLPWYRPTRVFLMAPGSDAGWVTRSWKRPNEDPLMPRVLAEFGRGSPTGVKRSQGEQLPQRFHEGTFVADWTFGRIIFVSDTGKVELVAQPSDFSGFAVTDIETLSDGRLIVSVGGRGSKGGLYLIDGTNNPNQDTPGSLSENDQKQMAMNPWTLAGPDWEESSSPILKRIIELRKKKNKEVDIRAAEQAITVMEKSGIGQRDWLEATALIIESVGGLGKGDPKDARGETQVAPVFDGYRSVIRPQIEVSQINRATDVLLTEIPKQRGNVALQTELIRALAVLEPNRSDAIDLLIGEMQQSSTPTHQLHCLVAIARIPAKRNDDQTESIAIEMLRLTRRVRNEKLRTDRHWPLRLAELFEALQYRDSLLPSRIVAQSNFGDPADLVWMDRMDPENLERARQRLLATPLAGHDSEIANFIALGDDVVPRPILRQWLSQEATRSAGLIALTNDVRMSDAKTLLEQAWSSDSLIRKRVRTALERLQLEIPKRPNRSQSVNSWNLRSENILQIKGDVLLGAKIYQKTQCTKCHDGNRALGPRLEGVAKRYGGQDLLRSIYDPSHSIPDRYQSRIIITHDEQRLEGIPIYESVDGITLVSSTGETLRIEHEQIRQMKISPVSTMPEGLLDGLTNNEVAALLSYLQTR